MAKRLFTSESVTEGHPDKICDQISAAVLDAILAQDPQGRVACETTATPGLVHVKGEITTSCYGDIPKLARQGIRDIGYDRAKFGFDCDEGIDVVNLKLPTEMFGSFGAADGVYPAYHMNKLHWISVILPDAPNDVVQFLLSASFEATKSKIKQRKR